MYSSLIASNVSLAFQQMKDLAVAVTMHVDTRSGFNFNTGQVNNNPASSLPASAIFLETKGKTKSTKIEKKQVILKTREMAPITDYKTISEDASGLSWTIGPVYMTNGYITVAEVYREV